MLLGQVDKLHQNLNDFHEFSKCFLEGGISKCGVDTSSVVDFMHYEPKQIYF